MTAARVHAAGPGITETAVMATAILLFFADVPWAWTRVVTPGEAVGGDVLVSLLFIAIAGFLGLQMNGRWPQFLSIVGREPILVAFLLWAFITVLWASDPAFSGRRVIALLVTTYIAMHLVMRFTQFEMLRLIASVFVFVALVNLVWILALPQFSGPVGNQGVNGTLGFDNRLTGIYTSPNSLGRVMSLGIFTMLAALKLDRRRRLLYLIGLGAGGLVLAFSQSKTSLVVAILASVLLVVFIVFRSRKTLFGAVVISVFGSAVISFVTVLTNLRFFTDALDRDITLTGRVPLWQDVIEIVPDHMPFGTGFQGFWNGWYSPAHEIWNQYEWFPPHSHQQFLDVLLEMGAIGLLLYTALIVRTFVRATRFVRDVPGVFGLWPLTYSCLFLLSNLTEAAMISRDIGWFLLVASIVLVSTKKTSVDLEVIDEPKPETIELVHTARS